MGGQALHILKYALYSLLFRSLFCRVGSPTWSQNDAGLALHAGFAYGVDAVSTTTIPPGSSEIELSLGGAVPLVAKTAPRAQEPTKTPRHGSNIEPKTTPRGFQVAKSDAQNW